MSSAEIDVVIAPSGELVLVAALEPGLAAGEEVLLSARGFVARRRGGRHGRIEPVYRLAPNLAALARRAGGVFVRDLTSGRDLYVSLGGGPRREL